MDLYRSDDLVKDITKNVHNVYFMRDVFVAVMLAFIILLAFFINRIVQHLLKQFYEILKSIRKVQKGDLDVVIENCGKDEMGELGTQINKMLERIKELMEDNLNREMLAKNSEIRAITNKFYSSTHRGPSELCGNVFKIEYTKKRQRLAYIRLYSGVLHLRDSVRVSEKEKIKVTEMYTSINGELCKIDRAYSGEIVILQNEFLKLNSVLGDTKLLPQRKKIENPHPLLQTTVEPSKPEQREMLLDALLEISDSDPLLRYYVDSTTHEIILSFLGKVQMEVISALLQEKYHVEIELKEPTVIYMERPLKNAEYTIHIEVPPNPFWASIGLSATVRIRYSPQ